MGHAGCGLAGWLLLGHSLGGCSSGETADRYKDKPTWFGVGVSRLLGQSHRSERSMVSWAGGSGRPRGRCSA